MFLLDANILVDANRDYYPINDVPEFWEWLVQQGNSSLVKIPREIFDEILNGNPDGLTVWLKKPEVESALLLQEEVSVDEVNKVLEEGYADDLNDIEIESIGRDPFLIAYALKNPERHVITSEKPKPSKIRQNRHIPDVCDSLDVPWGNTFMLTKSLGFSTHWKK